MRILYLDPFSGIAGDMLVGALLDLDLGLDLEHLKKELAKLKLAGYRLEVQPVIRGSIAGQKFNVLVEEGQGSTSAPRISTGHRHSGESGHQDTHDHHHDGGHPNAHGHHHHDHGHDSHHRLHGDHPHRHFSDIRKLIQESTLLDRVKEQSLKAFGLLAEVEGRMHGMDPEEVAFHEVGAIDSLVDIVGACIGFEALNIEQIWCGPIALGGDDLQGAYVECVHGKLPIPAPATLDLVKGLPLRSSGVAKELTTPTGAALMKALAAKFCPLPPMIIESIGYGAGTRNDPKIPIPNVLRAVLGEVEVDAESQTCDTILEIQANIDDSSPEVLGYLSDILMEDGALDVFHTPVQMKKSRPATLVTVLAVPGNFDRVIARIFRETTTFGIRYDSKSRVKLVREMKQVQTPFGEVAVKLGFWEGKRITVHPEFEDCKRLADTTGIPVRQIMDAAREAASGSQRGA